MSRSYDLCLCNSLSKKLSICHGIHTLALLLHTSFNHSTQGRGYYPIPASLSMLLFPFLMYSKARTSSELSSYSKLHASKGFKSMVPNCVIPPPLPNLHNHRATHGRHHGTSEYFPGLQSPNPDPCPKPYWPVISKHGHQELCRLSTLYFIHR